MKIIFSINKSWVLVLAAVLFSCTESAVENLPAPEPELSHQSFYSWKLGNEEDKEVQSLGGFVIAGGGRDVDEAMRWMLQRAAGGDVKVLRIAGDREPRDSDDAYNPYFFNELGIPVNSVETIFLNSNAVAQNKAVAEKIRQSEALFFTGGDQADYQYYLKGTALQQAIQYVINEKKAVIGGTSAGAMILGSMVFSAENGTVYSKEALKDPYNEYMTLEEGHFSSDLFQHTIIDTHLDNPDRKGRLVGFMARMATDHSVVPKGIGLQEQTALVIDPDGSAEVFGRGTVYYLQASSQENLPENCQANEPLHWEHNQKALQVFTFEKGEAFILPALEPEVFRYWFVEQGELKGLE